MNSQEFFKLFRLEKVIQESNNMLFSVEYRSLFKLNNTEISLSAWKNNVFQITLQTDAFGKNRTAQNLNIFFDLNNDSVKLDITQPFLNEVFPFLVFDKDNITNSLTYLSEIMYNVLIPEYELISNIFYYGDNRL